MKKVTLMYKLFGKKYGKCCRDCSNFCREWTNTRSVFKCEVYGKTNSEASDWAGKYEACGMFCKKWNDKPIMRLVRTEKENGEPPEPIPGQMTLFEGRAET